MEKIREKEIEIICIECPLGCRGRVVTDDKGDVKFEGYGCKEGKKYAEAEAKEPLRTLTATVITDGKIRPLLPVRTNKPVPKNKLRDCMGVLAKVRVKSPVKMGEVIIHNVMDTEADIISTMAINSSD